MLHRYTGCCIDVFGSCFEHVAAMRMEGFVIVSCTPSAGRLANSGDRYVDNYIMYCETSAEPV